MIVEDRYIPSTEAVKFIAKAKDKYGDRYNYDKVEYLHSKSKVIITCPEHGGFMQSTNQHLNLKNAGYKYTPKKKFNGSSECYKCKYIEEINI